MSLRIPSVHEMLEDVKYSRDRNPNGGKMSHGDWLAKSNEKITKTKYIELYDVGKLSLIQKGDGEYETRFWYNGNEWVVFLTWHDSHGWSLMITQDRANGHTASTGGVFHQNVMDAISLAEREWFEYVQRILKSSVKKSLTLGDLVDDTGAWYRASVDIDGVTYVFEHDEKYFDTRMGGSSLYASIPGKMGLVRIEDIVNDSMPVTILKSDDKAHDVVTREPTDMIKEEDKQYFIEEYPMNVWRIIDLIGRPTFESFYTREEAQARADELNRVGKSSITKDRTITFQLEGSLTPVELVFIGNQSFGASDEWEGDVFLWTGDRMQDLVEFEIFYKESVGDADDDFSYMSITNENTGERWDMEGKHGQAEEMAKRLWVSARASVKKSLKKDNYEKTYIYETYGHDVVDSAFAFWDGGWRPQDVDDAIEEYGDEEYTREIFQAMKEMDIAGWFDKDPKDYMEKSSNPDAVRKNEYYEYNIYREEDDGYWQFVSMEYSDEGDDISQIIVDVTQWAKEDNARYKIEGKDGQSDTFVSPNGAISKAKNSRAEAVAEDIKKNFKYKGFHIVANNFNEIMVYKHHPDYTSNLVSVFNDFGEAQAWIDQHGADYLSVHTVKAHSNKSWSVQNKVGKSIPWVKREGYQDGVKFPNVFSFDTVNGRLHAESDYDTNTDDMYENDYTAEAYDPRHSYFYITIILTDYSDNADFKIMMRYDAGEGHYTEGYAKWDEIENALGDMADALISSWEKEQKYPPYNYFVDENELDDDTDPQNEHAWKSVKPMNRMNKEDVKELEEVLDKVLQRSGNTYLKKALDFDKVYAYMISEIQKERERFVRESKNTAEVRFVDWIGERSLQLLEDLLTEFKQKRIGKSVTKSDNKGTVRKLDTKPRRGSRVKFRGQEGTVEYSDYSYATGYVGAMVRFDDTSFAQSLKDPSAQGYDEPTVFIPIDQLEKSDKLTKNDYPQSLRIDADLGNGYEVFDAQGDFSGGYATYEWNIYNAYVKLYAYMGEPGARLIVTVNGREVFDDDHFEDVEDASSTATAVIENLADEGRIKKSASSLQKSSDRVQLNILNGGIDGHVKKCTIKPNITKGDYMGMEEGKFYYSAVSSNRMTASLQGTLFGASSLKDAIEGAKLMALTNPGNTGGGAVWRVEPGFGADIWTLILYNPALGRYMSHLDWSVAEKHGINDTDQTDAESLFEAYGVSKSIKKIRKTKFDKSKSAESLKKLNASNGKLILAVVHGKERDAVVFVDRPEDREYAFAYGIGWDGSYWSQGYYGYTFYQEALLDAQRHLRDAISIEEFDYTESILDEIRHMKDIGKMKKSDTKR